MGKFSRDKGARFERLIVNILKESGLDAVRVPLSGATVFQKGDVILDDKVLELKHHESGFKSLYSFLEGADYLIVKQNMYDPLVTMRLVDFIYLYKKSVGMI